MHGKIHVSLRFTALIGNIFDRLLYIIMKYKK